MYWIFRRDFCSGHLSRFYKNHKYANASTIDSRVTLPATLYTLFVTLKCALKKGVYYSNSCIKDTFFISCNVPSDNFLIRARLLRKHNVHALRAIRSRWTLIKDMRYISQTEFPRSSTEIIEQWTDNYCREKSRELGRCALRGSYRKSVIMTFAPNCKFHVTHDITSYLIVITPYEHVLS